MGADQPLLRPQHVAHTAIYIYTYIYNIYMYIYIIYIYIYIIYIYIYIYMSSTLLSIYIYSQKKGAGEVGADQPLLRPQHVARGLEHVRAVHSLLALLVQKYKY